MRIFGKFLGAVLLLVGTASTALAATPLATVQGPVESVLATLKDPRYAHATPTLREEQHRKIRGIIQGLFDYGEISSRAVGSNWKRFNPGQQKAFTAAFSDLLANTYIHRIQREYRNERVVFAGEETVASTKAVVRTKIVGEGGETPVDYLLKEEGSGWRIYDINVEGVSLVQNYRSQFGQILLNGSPDQLIAQIQKKNREEAGKS